MKTFLSTACAALFAVAAFAQTVVVTPTENQMSLGAHQALAVQLHGIEADDALEQMESFLKDRGAKADEKDKEVMATSYEPKELKPAVFTVYARATKQKDGSMLYLWANDGTQFVAPPHPAYAHFERELKSFAVAEIRRPYEKLLKESERSLEKTTDERKSIERDRAGWQKDIDDCNKTIQDKQSKLKDSESNLSKTTEREKELQNETAKLKQQIERIQ